MNCINFHSKAAWESEHANCKYFYINGNLEKDTGKWNGFEIYTKLKPMGKFSHGSCIETLLLYEQWANFLMKVVQRPSFCMSNEGECEHY